MTIDNLINKYPRRAALIASVLIFLLYASTTPSVNVGYGDSDEFLAVSNAGGIAHPPGYPLYTTVLDGAMRIPLYGTTKAQRAHLVSGLSAAVAIYFMTLTLMVLTHDEKRKKSLRLYAIGATIISIATAKLYWTYAQIAEKYIFTSLLMSMVIYLGTMIFKTKQTSAKQFFLLTLCFGLMLNHHQSTVFLLPYVAFLLYHSKAYRSVKHMAGSALGMIIGFLSPLILLVMRSNPTDAISWYIKPGIEGIIAFITREDFRGQLYYSNTISSGYIPNQLTLNQIITGSWHYLTTVGQSYSYWVLIPLVFGAIYLWKSEKQKLILLSLPTILMGFGLASFLKWPSDLGSQATTVRFYIPSIITISPLLCLGLLEMFDRLIVSAKILGIKRQIGVTLGVAAVSVPLLLTVMNVKAISLKDFTLISNLYTSILDKVEPQSIITCYSDSSCFALLYEQSVNKRRPDVDVIPLAFPLVKHKLAEKNLMGFSYPKNPYLTHDIVTWNIDKRPVYAVDISQYYFSLYGINNAFMYYIPEGYYGRLVRNVPSEIAEYDSDITNQYLKWTPNNADLMQLYLIESLSQTHVTNGYLWLKMGNRVRARKEFDKSVNLAYRLTKTQKVNIEATRAQLEQTQPDSRFQPRSRVTTATELLARVPDLLAKNLNAQALSIVRGAITIEPTNVAARLELARMYEKMGDPAFTLKEYQNVLLLDPQNQEARDKVGTRSQ